MTFKTPKEISQDKQGMNINIEEIEAVCAKARDEISHALDRWKDGVKKVTAQIEISEGEWQIAWPIVGSELEESGWEIIECWYGAKMKARRIDDCQMMAVPDGDKKCISVNISPIKAKPIKRNFLLRLLGA